MMCRQHVLVYSLTVPAVPYCCTVVYYSAISPCTVGKGVTANARRLWPEIVRLSFVAHSSYAGRRRGGIPRRESCTGRMGFPNCGGLTVAAENLERVQRILCVCKSYRAGQSRYSTYLHILTKTQLTGMSIVSNKYNKAYTVGASGC